MDCPQYSYYYNRGDLDNDAYCGQTRVIGVKCGELPSKFHNSTIKNIYDVLIHILYVTTEPDCNTEYAVRLVGGPKESEGQLQMCKNERWRDVCSSSSYYKNIGITACRQLGYTSKCEY